MAKILAWVLFIFTSGLFIASLAQQQLAMGYDEIYAKCSQPLSDMIRFQQACAAADAAEAEATEAAEAGKTADAADVNDVED